MDPLSIASALSMCVTLTAAVWYKLEELRKIRPECEHISDRVGIVLESLKNLHGWIPCTISTVEVGDKYTVNRHDNHKSELGVPSEYIIPDEEDKMPPQSVGTEGNKVKWTEGNKVKCKLLIREANEGFKKQLESLRMTMELIKKFAEKMLSDPPSYFRRFSRFFHSLSGKYTRLLDDLNTCLSQQITDANFATSLELLELADQNRQALEQNQDTLTAVKDEIIGEILAGEQAVSDELIKAIQQIEELKKSSETGDLSLKKQFALLQIELNSKFGSQFNTLVEVKTKALRAAIAAEEAEQAAKDVKQSVEEAKKEILEDLQRKEGQMKKLESHLRGQIGVVEEALMSAVKTAISDIHSLRQTAETLAKPIQELQELLQKIDKKLSTEFDRIVNALEEGRTAALEAKVAAEAARAAAGGAMKASEEAKTAAEGAQRAALNANSAAEGAQMAASNAESAANDGKIASEGAQEAALSAVKAAEGAQTAASKVSQEIGQLTQIVNQMWEKQNSDAGGGPVSPANVITVTPREPLSPREMLIRAAMTAVNIYEVQSLLLAYPPETFTRLSIPTDHSTPLITPLIAAVHSGNLEVVQAVLKWIDDTHKTEDDVRKEIEFQDENGQSALSVAVFYENAKDAEGVRAAEPTTECVTEETRVASLLRAKLGISEPKREEPKVGWGKFVQNVGVFVGKLFDQQPPTCVLPIRCGSNTAIAPNFPYRSALGNYKTLIICSPRTLPLLGAKDDDDTCITSEVLKRLFRSGNYGKHMLKGGSNESVNFYASQEQKTCIIHVGLSVSEQLRNSVCRVTSAPLVIVTAQLAHVEQWTGIKKLCDVAAKQDAEKKQVRRIVVVHGTRRIPDFDELFSNEGSGYYEKIGLKKEGVPRKEDSTVDYFTDKDGRLSFQSVITPGGPICEHLFLKVRETSNTDHNQKMVGQLRKLLEDKPAMCSPRDQRNLIAATLSYSK